MSPSDPTFSKYTTGQAQKYAKERTSYADELYRLVIERHVRTGGALNVLADIGCGPGNATRDLAHSFDTAIGLDPGTEMINTARRLGGSTSSGKPIQYIVCGAEHISRVLEESCPGVKGHGVDLLTAAMAAHWFDMPKFWVEAARIHPPLTRQKFKKHSSVSERETLAPYELPPNRLSRDLYENLGLPWHTGDGAPVSHCFPQGEFERHEWDRDGVLSNGRSFFMGSERTTVDELASGLETASMVTRWREAHPDSTANDCVRQFALDVKEALGVTEGENPSLTVGNATVLLIFKRR
ncbi:S-adenosyl-L-methionine-dependent methyltransferase [Penicillium chermesinum]|uniref:S-adenosyl-L-methionine-dependent methyltransferase n=1 Tax=Penicillium chermesinum TaxID=63820 RepID=A0A9W9TZ20_9EURO|nr:S-adenosyl-L-methionine-dependent methyltransferase [Penicillium chermesinum]KAJ5248735.1 S-adenosyl-L-methionine-dependent methyltransferase [Penicillium chermesinum]